MSKTKPETSIDPVTEIAENGADSLRLALIQGSTAGRDTKFSKDQILASKRLVNKLWNAAKLVDIKTSDKNVGSLPAEIKHPVNRWILNRTQNVTEECTNWLNAYNLNEAAETIRRAFWGEFCDFYLEAIKCDSISGLDETPAVLRQSFDCFLRLFHPFTPFVTEQIWSELGHPEMLINSAWPVTAPESALPTEEGAEAVIRLISEIRRIRSENSFNPSAKVETVIQIKRFDETFRECEDIIYRMARTSSIDFVAPDFSFTDIQKKATIGVDRDFVVAVFLGTTDLEEERSRLLKQLEDEKKTLTALNDRLANEQFLARANSAVIEKTKKDASKMESVIASINERLDSLNGKNGS
jgi:valyl-tRNA synthetase